MSRGRLLVSLDWGDGQERPVAQLGWDPAARQVLAEWDKGFAAVPLPISPLLVADRLAQVRGGIEAGQHDVSLSAIMLSVSLAEVDQGITCWPP